MKSFRRSFSGHESWANARQRRTQRLSSEVIAEDGSVDLEATESQLQAQQLPLEDGLSLTIYCVHILLRGVIDMPIQDKILGSANPYAKISVGSVTYKSEIAKRTLNPEWNESFVFYTKEVNKVCLELKHHDNLTWNKSVGVAEFDPEVLFSMGMEDEYKTTLPVCQNSSKPKPNSSKGTFDVVFRCQKFKISEIVGELKKYKEEALGHGKLLQEQIDHRLAKEAELEIVRRKLSSLEDEMGAILEQKEALEQRAEKAEKGWRETFESFKAQEKELEMLKTHHKELDAVYRQLEADVIERTEKLLSALSSIEKSMSEAKVLLGEREEALERQAEKLGELQGELCVARRLLDKAGEELEYSRVTVGLREDKIAELEENLKVNLAERESLRNELTATESNLKYAEGKVRDMGDEMVRTEKRLGTEIGVLKREVAEEVEKGDALKKELGGVYGFLKNMPSIMAKHVNGSESESEN